MFLGVFSGLQNLQNNTLLIRFKGHGFKVLVPGFKVLVPGFKAGGRGAAEGAEFASVCPFVLKGKRTNGQTDKRRRKSRKTAIKVIPYKGLLPYKKLLVKSSL